MNPVLQTLIEAQTDGVLKASGVTSANFTTEGLRSSRGVVMGPWLPLPATFGRGGAGMLVACA